MQVDWAHFTPFSALTGGILIGLAAAALIIVEGRILGAAGILGGLVDSSRGDRAWRFALLGGLIAAPPVAMLILHVERPAFESGIGTLVAGGLLVGFGTRLGSGCTSGHGVCGLARLSLRSAVATVVFMTAGIATVYVARHILQ